MMFHPPDKKKTPLSDAILADVAERGGDQLSNLDKRLGRYAVAHERGLAMRDYIADQRPYGDGHGQSFRHQKAAHALHHCGSYMVFRHYTESDRVKLRGLRSCKQHIICPLCAIRRGAKMLARYLERFSLVSQANPHLVAHMVTLTVKNRADLEEAFDHLHASVKRFHKRRSRDHHEGSEAKKIRGAVWSYEFKRGGNSGLWHPHVHAVWLCERGNAPDAQRLGDEWKAITGDSHIVETHELYGEPMDAFAEVFKYAVKFGGLELEDNLHAFDVLRGRRMVASSGALFGVDVPDEELTDDELRDELVWVDLFYRFVRGQGYVFRGIAHTDEEAAA